MSSFVANCLEVVKGTFDDYKALKGYHYISSDPVCTRGIFKIHCKPPHTKSFPDPIAVIVYAVPIGEWAARNRATKNYFDKFTPKSKRQSTINTTITYLARIIVDPRFHRLGIGTQLLNETLKLQTHQLIETMTPLDFTSKMFLRAGFKLYHQPTPPKYTTMQKAFEKAHIPREIWHIPEMVQARVEHLTKYHSELFNHEVRIFLKNFHHHENMYKGFERIKFILSKIIYPNQYLLWENPGTPKILP